MQTSSDTPSDTQIARQRRGAARVFWLWLIVATAMLVTGNVTHAVLHAEAGTVARRPVPLRLLALLARHPFGRPAGTQPRRRTDLLVRADHDARTRVLRIRAVV